jgi:hypothetical protein
MLFVPSLAYANTGELRAKLNLVENENSNIFEQKLDEEKTEFIEDAESKFDTWEEYLTSTQIDLYNDLIDKAFSASSLGEIENYRSSIDSIMTKGEEAKEKAEEQARIAAEDAKKAKASEEAKTAQQSSTTSNTPTNSTSENEQSSSIGMTGQQFKSAGVVYMNGIRYTYYSSRVLYHYRTSEWYVDSNGFYRTADGYLVVACYFLPQGSTVSTPWGTGMVLDSGAGSNTVDMYVCF